MTERAGAASYFRYISHQLSPQELSVFTHPAPSTTVRIVIAGGSAAKGFPQSSAFSASAFLKMMLGDCLPGRHIEIINLGTTAVASYPALDMARQALRYEPDLVIVISGNNEFYGTYGVLSSPWAAVHPAALRVERWIRALGILQVTEPFLVRAEEYHEKALIEIMLSAAGGISAERRAAAAGTLRYNLERFIRACRAAGVPLIVCTLPVNEKDLAPIGGDPPGALPEAQQAALARGTNLLEHAPDQAVGVLTSVVAAAPASALARYYLGRAALACGRTNMARDAFGAAIERDPMPWRATPAIQSAIRDTARSCDVPVCDLLAGFRAHSPGGCVGWELMDDHVHPSLDGQVLIARLLATSMTQLPGRAHVPVARPAALPSDDVYLARAGDNPYDRWFVAMAMSDLCGLPFFRSNNPNAAVRFEQRADDTAAALRPALRAALRQTMGTSGQVVGHKPVSGFVAMALLREQRFAEAATLLEVALRSTSPYSSWNLEYAYYLLVCRQATQGLLTAADGAFARAALARGAFVLEHGFTGTGYSERYMARIHQMLGEHAQAIPLLQRARRKMHGLDRVATDRALIGAHLAVGSTNAALRIIRQGQLGDPRDAPVYDRLYQALDAAMAANTPNAAGHYSPASDGDPSATVFTK